ncbi:LppU/SCO3897 family protein [Streptomyces sp. 4F14]|uniref:LppU/SCO3897 family protein n=1 Tax=Streptomyces sp. 4F14 TaxID=3394380 RepID=UPI003A851A4D
MTTPPPQGQNPYAQQPVPMGEQHTQPYGQVPGQGAPFQAPTTPPQRNKKLKRVLGVVGMIVVAIIVKVGIGAVFSSDTEAESTSVGACMHNDGTNTKPDLSEVDCTSDKAQYKVVEKFDDTSDDSKCEAVKEATVSYYQIGTGHNVVLCLKDV